MTASPFQQHKRVIVPLVLLSIVTNVALQSSVEFVRDGTFQPAARWVEAITVPCILADGGAAKQDQIGNLSKVTAALQGPVAPAMLNLPWLPLSALNSVLAKAGQRQTDISAFNGNQACHNLIVPRGGGAPPRLDQVTFSINPGECLAIIGASGSGKSSLLLALAGIQPAPIGAVLMDQSDVRTLSHATVSAQVGYLPQQAELFDGTLSQNICAFDPNPDDARIVEAAKTAGCPGARHLCQSKVFVFG